MPETPETHKEIVTIKAEIKDIKATQELNIRLNQARYISYVDKVIGNSMERVRFFLAVNGARTLMEISRKTHIKPPNVSRAKKILEKEGLIYKLPDSGIYAKPRWVQVLNIDEHIQQKFRIEDSHE